jgi:hypothetical protein
MIGDISYVWRGTSSSLKLNLLLEAASEWTYEGSPDELIPRQHDTLGKNFLFRSDSLIFLHALYPRSVSLTAELETSPWRGLSPGAMTAKLYVLRLGFELCGLYDIRKMVQGAVDARLHFLNRERRLCDEDAAAELPLSAFISIYIQTSTSQRGAMEGTCYFLVTTRAVTFQNHM